MEQSAKPALKAGAAGEYLAKALGFPEPISEQAMWSYARSSAIPCVRIGRRIWFQVAALDAFILKGGTPR